MNQNLKKQINTIIKVQRIINDIIYLQICSFNEKIKNLERRIEKLEQKKNKRI